MAYLQSVRDQTLFLPFLVSEKGEVHKKGNCNYAEYSTTTLHHSIRLTESVHLILL
ncbi:hypothetical protein TFLX_02065 [Thermoflexales bacterium]|nr:hypothetical protein TFLX_02065 [Thermoflexales bacterium]